MEKHVLSSHKFELSIISGVIFKGISARVICVEVLFNYVILMCFDMFCKIF